MKSYGCFRSVSRAISMLVLALIFATCYASASAESNQDQAQEIIKDEYYFMKFHEITKDEKERRMAELDIKYPEAIHFTGFVNTLVVRDHGDYKILPVLGVYNSIDERFEVYDLFTEQKLFDLKESSETFYNEVECTSDNELIGHQFDSIEHAIPYFHDKEILEYGVSCYTADFFNKHLDEIREKDGIYYRFDKHILYSYIYEMPFSTGSCFFTTKKLADNYVTTVPEEYRVSSKELGVSSEYGKEEYRFFDFWKENEENIDTLMSKIEINNPDSVLGEEEVLTLVFTDENDRFKLMLVTYEKIADTVNIKDLFTDKHLFTVKEKNEARANADPSKPEYFFYDLDDITDVIPYFNGKVLHNLSDCYLPDVYVLVYFEEFRNKTGNDYVYPETSYIFDMKPAIREDSYLIIDMLTSNTKEGYARNYLIRAPKEVHVYTEDVFG